MTNEWSLRDEILIATHRWPVIVSFCLAGALLGFIVASIWPSPHRATKELYVGLEVVQAPTDKNASEHAGLQFANPDDYKNWQMASLNSMIYMDRTIDETLEMLRSEDAYWSNISRKELASMLHVYWRNAGKWRLVAESRDPQRAAQAVAAWHDVVIVRANKAIQASKKTMELDRQLKSLADVHSQIIVQESKLSQTLDFFRAWQAENSSLNPDFPLDDVKRWLLWQQLTQTGIGPSWAPVLDAFPEPQAPYKEYPLWIDQVIAGLEQEIQAIQSQMMTLEAEQGKTASEYADASQLSHGLSVSLKVDPITSARPEQTIERPTGLMVFIGSALGLILWAVWWLARISQRAGE